MYCRASAMDWIRSSCLMVVWLTMTRGPGSGKRPLYRRPLSRGPQPERRRGALPRPGLDLQRPAQVLAQARDQVQADAAALAPAPARAVRIDPADFLRRHPVPGIFDDHRRIRQQPYPDRAPVAVLYRVAQQVADGRLDDGQR